MAGAICLLFIPAFFGCSFKTAPLESAHLYNGPSVERVTPQLGAVAFLQGPPKIPSEAVGSVLYFRQQLHEANTHLYEHCSLGACHSAPAPGSLPVAHSTGSLLQDPFPRIPAPLHLPQDPCSVVTEPGSLPCCTWPRVPTQFYLPQRPWPTAPASGILSHCTHRAAPS